MIGAGLGATITPSMAAAFQDLGHAQMAQATSALNVVQRVAGALGTALLAVVLQTALSSDLTGFHGGSARPRRWRSWPHRVPAHIAAAFGTTFWVAGR